MMLEWLERTHGATLAAAVARQLMHERRPANTQAASPAGAADETLPAAVARALAIMEASTEAPLSIAALSRRIGLSQRQLGRLFRAHVGQTAQRCYLAIRLDHAQRILAASRLSVTEAALATGFEHLAHFSRAYKARFGESPRVTAQRGGPRTGAG